VDGLKYQHGIKDGALERSWPRIRDIKSAMCACYQYLRIYE